MEHHLQPARLHRDDGLDDVFIRRRAAIGAGTINGRDEMRAVARHAADFPVIGRGFFRQGFNAGL